MVEAASRDKSHDSTPKSNGAVAASGFAARNDRNGSRSSKTEDFRADGMVILILCHIYFQNIERFPASLTSADNQNQIATVSNSKTGRPPSSSHDPSTPNEKTPSTLATDANDVKSKSPVAVDPISQVRSPVGLMRSLQA